MCQDVLMVTEQRIETHSKYVCRNNRETGYRKVRVLVRLVHLKCYLLVTRVLSDTEVKRSGKQGELAYTPGQINEFQFDAGPATAQYLQDL